MILDFGFYNLDCMEGMRQFPDKYFDLAIVDPPYGIGASKMSLGAGSGVAPESGYRYKQNRLKGGEKLKDRIIQESTEWDEHPPTREYFDELMRVSKNQIIWGGNYFELPPTRGIVCWDKEQPFENFSGWEMAWTSFDKPAKIFHYSNAGFQRKDKDERIHPTQKPVALYKWLIQQFANEGDTILDTHVGSASSLIACHQTGHKFVWFVIDPGYYEKAKTRLEVAQSQISLFDIGEL